MNRRKFLETGAKGAAMAGIPILLRSELASALPAQPAEKMKLGDYYSHFGVDESAIRQVMAAALERGGDYCDLFFQHRISNSIGMEDQTVNRAFVNVDFGVGIRVLKGDQTGYSFTEAISPESMKQAARTAANIASGTAATPPAVLVPHPTPDYYPIEISWETVNIDRKIPFLQKLNDRAFAADSRIIKCQLSFSDESTYILVATSEGRVVYDYQPMTSIYLGCTAEQDGQRVDNYRILGNRKGLELYTQAALDNLADEAVRRTVLLFEAVKPEAGEMEVVLAAGDSGILLHEAIGHGMEADFNRKKESIFCEKMGEHVAESFVTIVDDGTLPNLRGSLNIDDEGNDTEKTILVENGVLRSYLHDRISSRYYQVKPTGNGRRQSFRHVPIPRMRTTYMLPGPHRKEEILHSVRKGLYTETFTNGQVDIGGGDFSFYVKMGYLIENGELTRPVKDVNIIGNGPEVLKKIVMVGDDLKMDRFGGTCGKNGQGAPVSMGLPTVKVSSINVGGIDS